MKKPLWTFVKSESGATAIEYGLITAFIVTVIVAAVTTLGGNLVTVFNQISGAF